MTNKTPFHFALVAAFAAAFASSPAMADCCDKGMCPHRMGIAKGSPHVDMLKDTMAPHSNVRGFEATGQLPTRNGDIYEQKEARRDMMPAHDKMHDKPKDMSHEKRKEMKEKRREQIRDMKNMNPDERAAAKARWEQKKKEWDALTPEQKAAIKAKREMQKIR